MKSLNKIMVATTLLLTIGVSAQIKNSITETVKVYGNCGMCETRIEKAGNLKNIAQVDWDENSKMATLTFDPNQTTKDLILKKIALSGYDNEQFLAPEDAYEALPGCCQYEREAKVAIKAELKSEVVIENSSAVSESQEANQLQLVFDTYFALKDALVKTDGNAAAAKATLLLSSIKAVKMETLKPEVHVVWIKVVNPLIEHSEHISDTKEVSHQRDHFSSLSINMYELMKVSKLERTVYYQFCPMAKNGKGANWLSDESAIKNPYYGSQMLTCGTVAEIIK